MASIPNKRILAQPSKRTNLVKINVQGLKGGRMGERLFWGASGSFQKPAVSQKSKQLSEREKKISVFILCQVSYIPSFSLGEREERIVDFHLGSI